LLDWVCVSQLEGKKRRERGVLGQRPRGHTSTTWSGGDRHAGTKGHAVVYDGIAVTTHAPFVAIEDGRVDDIWILGPVPIRLIAGVGAFCAEGGFIGPDVVAVPVHEVCGGVD
jgi:hypothetical protein